MNKQNDEPNMKGFLEFVGNMKSNKTGNILTKESFEKDVSDFLIMEANKKSKNKKSKKSKNKDEKE